MNAFVLATANADKAREIRSILTGVSLRPRPSDVPDVLEDGETLEENAHKKARALCAATGEAAIADDTGLFVDALDGAPGVHSARYAGPHSTYRDNLERLLQALAGVPGERRTARFETVAVADFPDGRSLTAIGTVTGRITDAPRGYAGFGYDPVFVPDDGDGRTLAELSAAEKDALSHRGRAFRALADALVVA